MRQTSEQLRNMLEDVVNELDLSDLAIDKHGQEGTPPAELVRLVLKEKDKRIAMLQQGMIDVSGLDLRDRIHIRDESREMVDKERHANVHSVFRGILQGIEDGP